MAEPFTEEQQELVDKLVGDARTKERGKYEALTAKAKEDAAQAALVDSEEWQKLAGQHESRVKALEPLEAKVVAYDKVFTNMLTEQVKSMGDAAKTAVGALPESMGDLEKLEWLRTNAALFQESGGPVGTPRREHKPAPEGGPKERRPERKLTM